MIFTPWRDTLQRVGKETPNKTSLLARMRLRRLKRRYIWNRVIISGIVMMQSSMVTALIRLA